MVVVGRRRNKLGKKRVRTTTEIEKKIEGKGGSSVGVSINAAAAAGDQAKQQRYE
jgi:hypothetical protein